MLLIELQVKQKQKGQNYFAIKSHRANANSSNEMWENFNYLTTYQNNSGHLYT